MSSATDSGVRNHDAAERMGSGYSAPPRDILRVALELQLHTDRAGVLEAYAAIAPEDVVRPITASAHDPTTAWSAKDHLAHLAYVESRFNAIIRAHLAGDPNPLGWTWPGGRHRTREELLAGFATLREQWAQALMASIHAELEAAMQQYHEDSCSAVVALGQRVRGETLVLLANLTDAQLAEHIPGSPFADGTIGGLLANNGSHGRHHVGWVHNGLAREVSYTATPTEG